MVSKRQPMDQQPRVVRCNVPWARKYVPGGPGSGTDLPEGCKQSTLGAPPDRCVWVARYRHPLLQDAEKRPTRSKTFTPPSGDPLPGCTEHSAFQAVLRWLWERHDEVCCQIGTASPRPEWVTKALEPCRACTTAPGDCTFISEQKALAPATTIKGKEVAEGLSGDSENWSGEGTSEDTSSSGDKPRFRLHSKTPTARSRRPQVAHPQKAPPRSTTTPISGGLPRREGVHQVLVVGDINAQDLGALCEQVDVTVVARSGASWQKIAKDVQAFMPKWLRGTWKHRFDMVMTVLGSDVPKPRAREQTWEKAQECMKTVLKGLHMCLMDGHPTTKIFASTPFNLEDTQVTVSSYKPSHLESPSLLGTCLI